MKVRTALRVLGIASCLWALMASQCPGTSSTIVFTFALDPGGTTTGQVPVETYEVVIQYGLIGVTGGGVGHGWTYSFLVDAGVEYEKELPCVVYAAGDYEWRAQAYARRDERAYIAATASGELYTAARVPLMWAVRFPQRDAHIVVEVGDEDPAALLYHFTIMDQEQTRDLATSPALDYDEAPLSWDFLVPSGAYCCSGRSYTAAYADCQDEDLSQMVTGPVSVEPAQTKTIVVNFDTSPLLPPTGVVATFHHPESIEVRWDAVTDIDSYNLYWAMTPGVTKASGTKIEGVTSPYTHTPVAIGPTYFYVITAVQGAEESAESEEASETPQG